MAVPPTSADDGSPPVLADPLISGAATEAFWKVAMYPVLVSAAATT